jgi:hypothetical protein
MTLAEQIARDIQDEHILDDLIVDTIRTHDAMTSSNTQAEFDHAQEQARQLLVRVNALREGRF